MSNILKDDFEDNKIGTPMNRREEFLLKNLTLTQKLEQLGKYSKSIMGCTTLKQLFNQLRLAIKTLFRCETSYLLLRSKDICDDFKREKGYTTSLRIENGNDIKINSYRMV